MAKLNQDRVTHLADAYLAVARVNHYLVGVRDDGRSITYEEASAARQKLIDHQNALPRKSHEWKVVDLALDLIDNDVEWFERGHYPYGTPPSD